MPNPLDTKIISVVEGAKIAALLPYLEAEIRRRDAAIETKAALAHLNGKLDPQTALNLWIEKLALRSILRSFEQKVGYGAAVGAEIGPEMDIPTP